MVNKLNNIPAKERQCPLDTDPSCRIPLTDKYSVEQVVGENITGVFVFFPSKENKTEHSQMIMNKFL